MFYSAKYSFSTNVKFRVYPIEDSCYVDPNNYLHMVFSLNMLLKKLHNHLIYAVPNYYINTMQITS